MNNALRQLPRVLERQVINAKSQVTQSDLRHRLRTRNSFDAMLAYFSGGMSIEETHKQWTELEHKDIYQARGFAAVLMEERWLRWSSNEIPAHYEPSGCVNSGEGDA